MIGWHYLKDCFSTSDISISSDSLFAARSTSILVFVSRSISSMVAFLYKSFIIIPTNLFLRSVHFLGDHTITEHSLYRLENISLVFHISPDNTSCTSFRCGSTLYSRACCLSSLFVIFLYNPVTAGQIL